VIGDRPLSIEVTRLSKGFQIPGHKYETLKERAIHPFKRETDRELRVLKDISFKVPRGEFLGIVGRNGSGKSTLLKLLASVYRPDSGGIKVAGTIAPIIELGVGFQPELRAYDNIVLNGLMLGLTPREARRRFDAVLEFSELQEFVDMKLKNYSSGMRVRLAFAIAMQTDPDVLLLDEVLAVGDPPFQRRCQEAFEQIKRERKKTVLLVTHAMANVERHCDRALLLEDGCIDRIGDPVTVGERYLDLSPSPTITPRPTPIEDLNWIPADVARVARVRVIDSDGRPTHTTSPGNPLRVQISVDARTRLENPRLLMQISDPAGVTIFAPGPIDLSRHSDRLARGDRVDVGARFENRLQPGHYLVSCVLAAGPASSDSGFSDPAAAEFEVRPDGRSDSGLVSLDYEVSVGNDSRGGS
jgi:ABC-type polysaccharide/polyol phosphate transport system ATPase subunit